MALGDKQSGVWTVSPPAFITLRGHDISTLSYSNHIEHNFKSKRYAHHRFTMHTSYKMNFRNQMWISYPSNHLSAYKPHSKTFHNRCKRQLLRTCGKKISCIDSMWWYSCQKDFPNPLLPIVPSGMYCFFHKPVRFTHPRQQLPQSFKQSRHISISHAWFLHFTTQSASWSWSSIQSP